MNGSEALVELLTHLAVRTDLYFKLFLAVLVWNVGLSVELWWLRRGLTDLHEEINVLRDVDEDGEQIGIGGRRFDNQEAAKDGTESPGRQRR